MAAAAAVVVGGGGGGGVWCLVFGVGVGVGVVGVLTSTRIIKSVVTRQAPVTLDWRKTPRKKRKQAKRVTLPDSPHFKSLLARPDATRPVPGGLKHLLIRPHSTRPVPGDLKHLLTRPHSTREIKKTS